MKDRILVTGASGFIGRYVVDMLLQNGYEVTVLLHKHPIQSDKRVRVIEADICEEKMIEIAAHQIENCDIVIHLAADLNMMGSDQTILTNCLGTYHLLRFAENVSVKRFIYMSSIPVIGVPQNHPVIEEHPIAPKTLYHITKYTGEQIVMQKSSEEMKTMILRIPSPIGIGMNENNYLSFLLKKCKRNETIELYGEGRRSQNYIDVRDIASAVLCSISAGDSGVYLIAGKKEITNRNLAFLCKKITKSSSDIIWGRKEDPEEKNQWIISGQKALRSLGFFPQYELEDTIRWIVDNMEKIK